MPRFINKTKIEWCDATWNPVTGCKHLCPWCYARKFAENPFYAKAFPYGFDPHFYQERLDAPLKLKKHSRIFCVSMGDLFGEWIQGAWLTDIFETMAAAFWHDFFILTKNPRGIRKLYDETTNWYFGGGDYLPNVYLGVSVTCEEDIARITELKKQWVGPKFISFEPLLDDVGSPDLSGISWAIIGAQTQPHKYPNANWVAEIILTCEEHEVPVFMKDNLGDNVFKYCEKRTDPPLADRVLSDYRRVCSESNRPV